MPGGRGRDDRIGRSSLRTETCDVWTDRMLRCFDH